MNYGSVIAVKRTEAPRNYSATGYGNRIPTDLMVRINGLFNPSRTKLIYCYNEKIFRRVYAICYSNCASFYCKIKGEKVFLCDSDLDITKKE